eukprot:gene28025-64712_t
MVLAFGISSAAAVGMTGGLNRLAADLNDVAHWRLDAATASRSLTHPSQIYEVLQMQTNLKVLVNRLVEFRYYLPDFKAFAKLDEDEDDDDAHAEALGASRSRPPEERKCTVRITHISRKKQRSERKRLKSKGTADSRA